MDVTEAGLPYEKILIVAELIEDVATIHKLHKEIDMLQDVPQEIKKQFEMINDTVEFLNILKATSITRLVPNDYESAYTKIKRGYAYVKIDDHWDKLGPVTNDTTIANLTQKRAGIMMETLSLFEIMAMELHEWDKGMDKGGSNAEGKEVIEMNKRFNELMSTKTLAIILRNISERFFLNTQDQYGALEGIYLTIKKIIEKRYEMEENSFIDNEIIKEIEGADQNYTVYNTRIKNSIFEERIKEELKEIDKIKEQPEVFEILLKDIYDTMPPYYCNQELLKILLAEEEEKNNIDALEAELNALAQPKEQEDTRQKIIKKLMENRERSKDNFYELLEKNLKQKSKQQIKLIEQLGGQEIFEKINNAVEDMVVMGRLQKQIEKMKVSDEIKMKFALLTQTMELRHLLRSGIVTRSHTKDFWLIRDGVAYLKEPDMKYFGIPNEIRLGKVVEERDNALKRLATYRVEVFNSLKELVKKEIKNLDSVEIAEFMECIGRRLTLKHQEQHSAIVQLVEIVWQQLKETYKEEMAKIERIQDEKEKALAEDEFALRSDRIASSVEKTIKYMEDAKSLNRKVGKVISAVEDEIYSFYLEAKEKNIIRFREESKGYINEVEDVYLSVPVFREDIQNGGKGPGKEQVDALFRIESVDHDKVLLKGARDRAIPLLSEMEEIIKMIKDERYNDAQKEKLEILFEVSAILISKFVMRFQIPYILKEGKGGPEVRRINNVESIFMLGGFVHFLDLLYKWEEVRAPYYEYKFETLRAIERITMEALCPSITSMEEAYKSVKKINMMAGSNEKVKKDIKEVIGYIADKVMAIDAEKRDNGQKLTENEKIYASIVLNMAFLYTSSNEYKEYADSEYGDWRLNAIKKLKTEQKTEEIKFVLEILDVSLSEEVLKTQIEPHELRKFFLSRVLQELTDLEKEVKEKWVGDNLKILMLLKTKILLQLNDLDKSTADILNLSSVGGKQEVKEKRRGGLGRIGI